MSPASLTIQPGPLRGGSLTVPGDKSISHRALILSGLAEGETCIHGLLESADCIATAGALRQLGVTIKLSPQSCRPPFHIVKGAGLAGLRGPSAPIDCGNSGTAMRLLAGVLAAQPFDSVLVGDESLSLRPMKRVAEPLSRMGAVIEATPAGTPPLKISGRDSLQGIDANLPVASAQVKSAILLAGLRAHGVTRVVEPHASRDHTERMLEAFGVELVREAHAVTLAGPQRLVSPGAIDVPGDLSSAAFFLVLGAIAPGCRIELRNVGINPTRDGVLHLLRRMGAPLEIREVSQTRGGEPVADILVEPGPLQAIELDAADVAASIDEIPALLIAAACAKGTTIVRGAAELRVKESDRLKAMAAGLARLGISVEEFPDGIAVTGGKLQGGMVDSLGDHRIAMSFATAGAVAAGPIRIRNTDNIATSYPGFVRDARKLGMNLGVSEE